MDKTRQIILGNKKGFPHFVYYLDVLDKIEENVEVMPDVAIESCKALFEGVSKTLLKDSGEDSFKVESLSVSPNKLFKKALDEMAKHSSSIDISFTQSASGFVHRLSEVRNERGDISHGKSAPKMICSDSHLSEMVASTTDAIISYVLKIYFSVKLSPFVELQYEDNTEFNGFLDSENELEGVSYSRALFDQDNILYREKLKNYLSDKEEGV